MEQLVGCPVFEALAPHDRARLLERALPRSLVRGERLYLTGDPSARAHALMGGAIKLVARDGGGRETIVCLAVPGEIVGDMALIDGGTQPFDAVAASRATVLGVDASVLRELLGSSPAAALALSRALARRLRWMGDTAAERHSAEVPARLAGRLLDLAELLGREDNGAYELDLPLGQGDLGGLAGMCRESACKALRRFKSEGLVDYRGRRLRILRPDLLEYVRCAGRSQKVSLSAQAGRISADRR